MGLCLDKRDMEYNLSVSRPGSPYRRSALALFTASGSQNLEASANLLRRSNYSW